ncbi:hypothetical protein K7432_017479, partial [Basidiobolus ranarum]
IGGWVHFRVWQWAKHSVKTAEGKQVNQQWLLQLLDEETNSLKKQLGNKYGSFKFDLAKKYMAGQVTGKDTDYADFLTTLIYDEITSLPNNKPKL